MTVRSKDLRKNVLKIRNSHQNIRSLSILVLFYNLSWEFHPFQSFAHWLRQNNTLNCSVLTSLPRPRSRNKPSTGWFHLKTKQGQQLWMYPPWLGFLLGCLCPQLSSGKEISLEFGACAGPACPQIHSLPFPFSAQHPQGRWPPQAAVLRLPVSGSFLQSSPNGCTGCLLEAGRKGEAKSFLSLLSSLGGKWEHLPTAPGPAEQACQHPNLHRWLCSRAPVKPPLLFVFPT